MFKTPLLALFALVLFTSQAHAGDALKTLLKQDSRPTIVEFQAAMEADYGPDWRKRSNPFSGSSRSLVPVHAARFIAALEFATPGATFAALGRDVAMLHDILDLFYTRIGQPGRAIPLNASNTSFPGRGGPNEDLELVYGFLRTNGLDLEKLSTSPRYTIFDISSYRETSQSTTLVRSVFRQNKKLGGDPVYLHSRFKFIGLGYSSSIAPTIEPGRDIHGFYKKQEKQLTDDGPPYPSYLPGFMMDYTYRAAWHPMFDTFKRQEDGSVTTSFPNERGYDQDRVAVFAEMFEVSKVVDDADFVEAVKSAALTFGYEFPMIRSEKLKIVAFKRATTPKAEAPVASAPVSINDYSKAYFKRMRGNVEAGRFGDKNKFARAVSEVLGDLDGMLVRGSVSPGHAAEFLRYVAKLLLMKRMNIDKYIKENASHEMRIEWSVANASDPAILSTQESFRDSMGVHEGSSDMLFGIIKTEIERIEMRVFHEHISVPDGLKLMIEVMKLAEKTKGGNKALKNFAQSFVPGSSSVLVNLWGRARQMHCSSKVAK